MSYKGVKLRVVTAARSDRAGKSPSEATLLSTLQESLTVRFGDITVVQESWLPPSWLASGTGQIHKMQQVCLVIKDGVQKHCALHRMNY